MNWPPSVKAWRAIENDLPPGADHAKFRAAVNAAIRVYLSTGIDPSLWGRVAELLQSKSVESLCRAIDRLNDELHKQADALVAVHKQSTPEDGGSFIAVAAPIIGLTTKSVQQFGKVLSELREIAEFEAQYARHQEHGSDNTLGRNEMLYHNLLVAWLYVGGQLADSEGPLNRVMQAILSHILPDPLSTRAIRAIIQREKRRQS